LRKQSTSPTTHRAFQASSHQGRHQAPVRDSTRSEIPKSKEIRLAAMPRDLIDRPWLEAPIATAVAKTNQNPASIRLPVRSRSSMVVPPELGGCRRDYDKCQIWFPHSTTSARRLSSAGRTIDEAATPRHDPTIDRAI